MYQMTSRIRYSEIDQEGKLSIEALVNYFQDCSTFQSEDIGMGVSYLAEKNMAWVLTSWQIVVNRYPRLCEQVKIGTAPYDFKGFMGFRNFLMESEAGERLACANSVWTLLDTENARPAKATLEMLEKYRLAEKLEMDYAPRKIIAEGEGITLPPITIKSHHLDTNQHVNNGQYIRMAMDCVEKSFQVHQLRAEYRKSAILGDVLIPVLIRSNQTTYVVTLKDEREQPCCIVELKAE